jgi:hypothetical protein
MIFIHRSAIAALSQQNEQCSFFIAASQGHRSVARASQSQTEAVNTNIMHIQRGLFSALWADDFSLAVKKRQSSESF